MKFYIVFLLLTESPTPRATIYTSEQEACRAMSSGEAYYKKGIWMVDTGFDEKCGELILNSEQFSCELRSLRHVPNIVQGSCRPKEEFFFEVEGK